MRGLNVMTDAEVAALSEARKLRRYWAERGKHPLVWVAREPYVEHGQRHFRFVVRTTMNKEVMS